MRAILPRVSTGAALLFGLALLGGVAVALDWRELRKLAGGWDWRFSLPALAMTAVSYGALSAGLVAFAELVGLRLRRGLMLRIAFVSIAMNHVVSMGGAAGYSVRAALVSRQGDPAGTALAMSLLHSYLNNLMLMALIQIGVLQIAMGPAAKPVLRESLLLAAFASLLVVALMTGVLLAAGLRTRTFRLVRRSSRAVPSAWGSRLDAVARDIEAALALATDRARSAPLRAVAPVTLAALDWTATLLAFWFCLAAFGDRTSLGVLIGGCAIGMGAGFVSLIPGGLGTQEGSMAVVFSLLGVQLEHAVMAAILFRVVYYVVPFAVSLPLYLGLTRRPDR